MNDSSDFPRGHAAPLLLVGLFITLLRALYFNNPAVNIDEQFYLMAADRDNPKVSGLCEPLSPAVLAVLTQVIAACNAAGRSCSWVTSSSSN